MPKGRRPRDPSLRFDERWKLDPQTGCWNWQAAWGVGKGYPDFYVAGVGSMRASHFALKRAGRGPAEGDMACHDCDNVRCVNPDHLYWGNAKSNHQDAVERQRIVPLRGRPPGFRHSDATKAKIGARQKGNFRRLLTRLIEQSRQSG